MSRHKETLKYARMRLSHTTLRSALHVFVPDRGDYVHLRNFVTGETVATFRTKEAFDLWVECQPSRNLGREQLRTLLVKLADHSYLSGSGFDTENIVDEKGPRLYLYLDWHFMSEHGYYDGWGSFRARFHVGLDPFDFRLYAMGKETHSKLRKHFSVREHIEASIHCALEECLPDWWGKIVWPGDPAPVDAEKETWHADLCP